MAVEPSLIASREYSTWNRRPSGEKVLLQVNKMLWYCLVITHLIPRSNPVLTETSHAFRIGVGTYHILSGR